MNKRNIHIIVNDVEKRIVINALCHLKEEAKKQGINHDILNDLIIHVCDAKTVKLNHKNNYETR